jgi:hypothetical protein
MSKETELVSEANCVLCRDLEPDERITMRADLLEVPLCEPVCEKCLRAWAGDAGLGCLLEEWTKHQACALRTIRSRGRAMRESG